MKYEYRISKYDPKRRDEHGAYPADGWTSISDIGRKFNGVVLTRDEYKRVENRYLNTVRLFAEAAKVEQLWIRGLEQYGKPQRTLQEGQSIELSQAIEVVRSLLREERFWCRLEADDLYVHIGRDYYMYIGTNVPTAVSAIEDFGLFAERGWPSPYHPD